MEMPLWALPDATAPEWEDRGPRGLAPSQTGSSRFGGIAADRTQPCRTAARLLWPAHLGKGLSPPGAPPTPANFSAGAPAQHHPPGASYQGWGPATSKKGLVPILRNLRVRSVGLHLVARAGRGRTRAPARAPLALRSPSLRQVLRAGGLGGGDPENCR